jgi:two-component system chemotaxis response regulator CheY
MKERPAGRVLVIDDDGPTRDFVQSILEGAGYAVAACRNGKEGLAAFSQGGFDLVVTDIAMPLIDGIDAIMFIRKSNAEVPIVAMSGAERSASFLKMADHFSADATIQKPFDKKRLLAAVEKAMKAA